ncbi:hypothetical protein GOODEAATRI_017523, partial [Goodea atripinnis]
VKRVREEDSLNEKSKGETKEGAKELLTMGDLQSHRKMFNLIKNTSDYSVNPPKVIVSRSHSGEVTNFLHTAFGNSTTIIPAGGAGGHMTTLKGENIDYSGTPLNKGGLVASVDVDHKAIVEKLPNWDPSKH